jgi:hypothetical protein
MLLACAVAQAASVAALYATRPRFIIAHLSAELQTEGLSGGALADQLDVEVKSHAYDLAVGRAAYVIIDTLQVTAIWFLLSAAFRRVARFDRLLIVTVVAGVASTVLFGVRELMAFGLGGDPGPFSFAGLVPHGSAAARWIGRIDLAKMWWAVVAGAGFAPLWRTSRRTATTITTAATALWLLVLGHSH